MFGKHLPDVKQAGAKISIPCASVSVCKTAQAAECEYEALCGRCAKPLCRGVRLEQNCCSGMLTSQPGLPPMDGHLQTLSVLPSAGLTHTPPCAGRASQAARMLPLKKTGALERRWTERDIAKWKERKNALVL